MIGGICIERGRPPADPKAYLGLSLRLADHARALGLRLAMAQPIRTRLSPTRYVYLLDQRDRRWCVRLSDHYRPGSTAEPHFDLVTLDGRSGFDEALAFVEQVAAGEARWFDQRDAVHHQPRRPSMLGKRGRR